MLTVNVGDEAYYAMNLLAILEVILYVTTVDGEIKYIRS